MKFLRASPEDFINAVKDLKHAGFTNDYRPGDLSYYKLFLSRNGLVGVGVSPTGEIVNLFSKTGAKRGAGKLALKFAMKRGGRSLNCFDGFLVGYYNAFKFVETARVKFSPALAAADWDYDKYGSPDIVTMVFMP